MSPSGSWWPDRVRVSFDADVWGEAVADARYDTIGRGYAEHRRPDPDLVARIDGLLSDARTVVNVGAGTGSYEPRDRHVVAIEPSDVMAAQRPPELAPASRASAGALPLRDDSVGAALAIMRIHHWGAGLETGLRELRRVARGPVILLTADPAVTRRMWLVTDYLPEFGAIDDAIFPAPDAIAAVLGPETRTEPWLVPRETPDHPSPPSGAARSASSIQPLAPRPPASRCSTTPSKPARCSDCEPTSSTAAGPPATVTCVSSTPTTRGSASSSTLGDRCEPPWRWRRPVTAAPDAQCVKSSRQSERRAGIPSAPSSSASISVRRVSFASRLSPRPSPSLPLMSKDPSSCSSSA